MATPREEIREALASKLTPEQIELLVDEVLAIKKGARGWCPSCKKHVQVEIHDARASVAALTDLLAQGFGKPVEEAKSDQGIVVNRTVVFEGVADV